MSLPAEAAATVVARESANAFLLEFAFVSARMRVWTGFGKLRTSDAREWDGLGEIISIDGLNLGLGTTASAGRIVASGVSSGVLDRARGEVGEFVLRPLIIYLQPFLNRAVYGAPVTLAQRLMTSMEVSRDGEHRTIAINHEGPYTGRRRPAGGRYSDRDQQLRYPGDKFCERDAFLLFKQEVWPHYTPA
jgi:hypothetical protein